jgi:hypothetical protein
MFFFLPWIMFLLVMLSMAQEHNFFFCWTTSYPAQVWNASLPNYCWQQCKSFTFVDLRNSFTKGSYCEKSPNVPLVSRSNIAWQQYWHEGLVESTGVLALKKSTRNYYSIHRSNFRYSCLGPTRSMIYLLIGRSGQCRLKQLWTKCSFTMHSSSSTE